MDLNAKIAERRQELAAQAQAQLAMDQAALREEAARKLDALGVKARVPAAGKVAQGKTVAAQVDSAINTAAMHRLTLGDWAGVLFALGAAVALFFYDSALTATLFVAGAILVFITRRGYYRRQILAEGKCAVAGHFDSGTDESSTALKGATLTFAGAVLATLSLFGPGVSMDYGGRIAIVVPGANLPTALLLVLLAGWVYPLWGMLGNRSLRTRAALLSAAVTLLLVLATGVGFTLAPMCFGDTCVSPAYGWWLYAVACCMLLVGTWVYCRKR